MKSYKQLGILLLLALVLIPIMVFMGTGLSNAENLDLVRVEFFVS
jgi:hypothetical protein